MMSKPAPAAPTLVTDIEQARRLLTPLCSSTGNEIPLPLLLLGAIWFAVERLRAAMQTSAQSDDWRATEKATEAKARELGMWPSRPKESWIEFRARIAAAIDSQGRA